MRKKFFLTTGALLLAVGAILAVGFASAAGPVNHGITFTKGCSSPTQIGQPYACSYQIFNIVDGAQDTLTITGLLDTVHAAGGDVLSGGGSATATFNQLKFEIVAGSPTCNGTGSGTSLDPFVNATMCTVPFGSTLAVQPFSFYTVQGADFNLAGHNLTDDAGLTWHDLCDDPAGTANTNCVNDPPVVGAGSQTVVQQLPSTTTTTIHDGGHNPVTTVAAGTTVHDFVKVDGGGGNPVPSGNVSIDWFLNGTCTGAPAANSGPIALNAAGELDATGFAFTVNTAGARGFLAHYLGDAANPTYTPSDGSCEPLQIVDANIQISPAAADNPVGTNHVLTITVNAIGGTLAAGTATASIVNGPGSFVGSPSCNYTGGAATASCTVTITSAVAGTTEVSATSGISVAGVTITRTTNTAANTAAGGSGNAMKTWIPPTLSSGRVTGGGSIFATINGVPNVRVTHGFELRCDPTDKRQSLEINWGGGNNFHLDKIINSVICFDDPTTQPPPPPGTIIDTYAGNTLFNGSAGYHGFGYAVGTGTCNKAPATIYFILIDAGEPGTEDTAEYHIVSSGCTLDAGPAQLLKGNHQFHKK